MKSWEHDNIIFITLPFFHSKIWEHDKKFGSMIKKLGARLPFCCTCSQIFYHAPRIVETPLLSLFLKGHLPGFHFSRGQSFDKFCVAPRFSSCSNYFYHAPNFFCEYHPNCGSMIKTIGAWYRFRSHAPNFSSCSNFFLHAPTFSCVFCPKFGSMKKKSWSMMSFMMSCSQIFIMLQFFLSCSHLFVRFLWKIWEHDKKNWCMM